MMIGTRCSSWQIVCRGTSSNGTSGEPGTERTPPTGQQCPTRWTPIFLGPWSTRWTRAFGKFWLTSTAFRIKTWTASSRSVSASPKCPPTSGRLFWPSYLPGSAQGATNVRRPLLQRRRAAAFSFGTRFREDLLDRYMRQYQVRDRPLLKRVVDVNRPETFL